MSTSKQWITPTQCAVRLPMGEQAAVWIDMSGQSKTYIVLRSAGRLLTSWLRRILAVETRTWSGRAGSKDRP